MKIGIFIQSSNQELYSKNTQIIKDYYKRARAGLQDEFDIYSFTSNPDSSCDYSYIYDDEMLLACNDRKVGIKIYEWISNTIYLMPKYDVVVKTNATTFLNLKRLSEFCSSELFDKDALYCSDIIAHGICRTKNGAIAESEKNASYYPNGNLHIFGYDFMKKLKKDYLISYIHLSDTLYSPKKEERDAEFGEWMWYGIPDDLVIGYVANKNGVPIKTVDNFAQLYTNGIFPQNVRSIPNLFDAIGFSCKVPQGYETRLAIEPDFIYTLTNLIENGTE